MVVRVSTLLVFLAGCLSAPAGEHDAGGPLVIDSGNTAVDGATGTWSFDSVLAPFAFTDYTSMATDGITLWLFRKTGGLLYRTDPTWDVWAPLPSIPNDLPGSFAGEMYDGAMVHTPSDQLLVGRWRLDGDVSGRLAVFTIAENSWETLGEDGGLTMNHGFVYLDGDHLLGLQHGGIEESFRRLTLSPYTEKVSESITGPAGPDPLWFSRAADMERVGDTIYVIKNDWTSSPPPSPTGDRLLSMPTSTLSVNNNVALTDLGPLPFEVGNGSCLAYVPEGFGGAGADGGLFVIAGESPSDEEGRGTFSSDFALYDLASSTWLPQGNLPFPVGGGTSCAFFDGAVVVAAATRTSDEDETTQHILHVGWSDP